MVEIEKEHMSETTLATFNLADLRRRAGISQSELARRMGVNRPRVGQIEQDFPRVRFNVVDAYIRALGGHATFSTQDGLVVRADHIAPDPRGPREHGYRKKNTESASSVDREG